jgi:hypothetical protein
MSRKITTFFVPNKKTKLNDNDNVVGENSPSTSANAEIADKNGGEGDSTEKRQVYEQHSTSNISCSRPTDSNCAESTIICESEAKPNCWSRQQCIDFKAKNEWLIVGAELGCDSCRSVSNLGAEKTQGLKLSQQWVLGIVSSYGKDKADHQKSLRKKIVEHRDSAAHKKAERILGLAKKKFMQDGVAKMCSEQQATTERIFRTAYKQAKLNRPFYEFESEIDLQICNGVDMGRILHSNVACSNIVHHISEEMQNDLIRNILESNAVFSLILDESTSLSNKACLIVYIRTQLKGMEKPKNMFLFLTELTDLTASGILRALLSELNRLGLNMEYIKSHLVSVTCDGAAVMLGKKNGFAKQLMEHFPNLIIWHCLNHRLELGVHDSVKEVSSGVNHFKIFMDKLRNVYSSSPKNSRQLADVAKSLNEEILKIGRVLDTRWVASSLLAVKAVWNNYSSLYNHFQQAAVDPERDAKERSTYLGLSNILSSTSFVHNLSIMYDALEELSDLSLQLQKSSLNLIQAHSDIRLMIKVFESRVENNGKRNIEAEVSIENLMFKDVPLTDRPKIPKIPTKQFYRSLANNMTNRLFGSENAGEKFEELLKDIKVVFPRYWPSQIDLTYGEDSIARLCETFKLNDLRDVIHDFRIFKEKIAPLLIGEKPEIHEEPPKLKQLISSINTVAVSSAECERGKLKLQFILLGNCSG